MSNTENSLLNNVELTIESLELFCKNFAGDSSIKLTNRQLQDYIDKIWLLGIIHQPVIETDANDTWSRLSVLVKNLSSLKSIDLPTLKTTLDIPLLVSAGLIKDPKAVQTMLVRLNTKLLYRQQKYNLLREETEGYSKLSIILNNIPYLSTENDLSNIINPSISQVFAIIGQFDLDPNRVLDVIIDYFELQPYNLSFIILLKQFNVSNIVHILGNKLIFYDCSENPKNVPVSLYAVTSVLLGSELVQLKELIPYLTPDPKVSQLEGSSQDTLIENMINTFGIKSLNSAVSVVDKEVNIEIKPLDPFERGDHWLGILVMLIEIRCWELANEFAVLLDSYHIDITRYDFVITALINFTIWLIEPIYIPISLAKLNLSGAELSVKQTESLYFRLIPYLKRTSNQLYEIKSFPHDILPFVKLLGPFVGRSQILVTRICRICFSLLSNEQTNTKNEIKNIISSSLLFGLTACEGSAYLSSQIWSVTSTLPFTERYELYDLWHCGKQGKAALGLKHNMVSMSETKVLVSCKGLLKRLAKDNTKLIGRQLGRLTHYAPMVVFEHILNQIEHYDNLIPYVVESLRYIPDLSRDALSYFFVVQLQRDSDKLKVGDTHYSSWFSALSKFIASYYKRFPLTDIKGVLNLLLRKLSDGESLDLLVLKDLLTIMGGCETLLEVSTNQLDSLAGGKILREQSMGFNLKDPINKKSSRILRDELLNSGTVLPMLLFIGQIRQRILFQTELNELKLMSYLYDTATDVLVQFTDFLIASKNIETFVSLFPPATQLINEIGLSLPILFQLARPLLRASFEYGIDVSNVPTYLQPWHPLSNNLIELVRNHMEIDVWDTISPQLYMMFWTLTMYDIKVPESVYVIELKRLKDKYTELDNKVAVNQNEIKQKKSDLNRVTTLIKDLNHEQETQRKHVENIKIQINKLKSNFFHLSNENSYNFNQVCIYERFRISPGDALFCGEFCFYLHELETPNFSTLNFFDKLIKININLLFCSTENEANFLGYFICHLLHYSNLWYKSEKLFQLQASCKIGFLSVMNGINKEKITYSEYMSVWKWWQEKIKIVLIYLLQSKEYMHIRAALLFLSKVTGNFPCLQSAADELMSRLYDIEKNETKRPDLQVMAKSVWAIIKTKLPTYIKDKTIETKEKSNNLKIEKSFDMTSESKVESKVSLESNIIGDYELGEEIEDKAVDIKNDRRNDSKLDSKLDSKRKLRSEETTNNNSDVGTDRKKHKNDNNNKKDKEKEREIEKDKDKEKEKEKDDRKRSIQTDESKSSKSVTASDKERLIREKLEKTSKSKHSEGILSTSSTNNPNISVIPMTPYPMRQQRNMFDVDFIPSHQNQVLPLQQQQGTHFNQNFSRSHRDYDHRRDGRENQRRR